MIRPLECNARLSFQEVEEKYSKVRDEFEKVKSHYSWLSRRFKGNLREEDNKILADCVEVLLPLGVENSIRGQILQVRNIKDTLFYQIGQLNVQIMNYLAKFKNTGVTRLQGCADPNIF
jgi:hypothetical protein